MDEHAAFTPPIIIEERIANTALTMTWRQSNDFRHQPLRQFTSRVDKVRSKPDTCAPYTDCFESTFLPQSSLPDLASHEQRPAKPQLQR